MTRTRKILLIVAAVFVAWLVVWTIGAAVVLDHGSWTGPRTPLQ